MGGLLLLSVSYCWLANTTVRTSPISKRNFRCSKSARQNFIFLRTSSDSDLSRFKRSGPVKTLGNGRRAGTRPALSVRFDAGVFKSDKDSEGSFSGPEMKMPAVLGRSIVQLADSDSTSTPLEIERKFDCRWCRCESVGTLERRRSRRFFSIPLISDRDPTPS